MRLRRHRPIDRDRWERLLDDPSRPSSTGRDPVTEVLAAAAGPARDRELRGEETALAAFRAARRHRVVPVPSTPGRRPARSRFTTGMVAWITVSAASAVAGVALAAGTRGHPQQPAPPDTAATDGAPTGHATHPAAEPTDQGSRTGTRPTPQRALPPTDSLPAVLAGLCAAYIDRQQTQRGRGAESEPPDALTEAAGGAEQVDEFCRRVLRTAGTAQPERSTGGVTRGAPTRPDQEGATRPG